MINPSKPTQILTEEEVHSICKDLEDGLGCTEISRKYNTSRDAVFQIKRGENWKHISSQYNFNGPKKKRPKLTEDQVRLICELHVKENLNATQISTQYCIPYDTVNKILNGKNWKNITREYGIGND